MSEEAFIEGSKLSIGYRMKRQNRIIQSNLNFKLYRGELTCLLGANGAGKSTLLRTLAATQPPLDGQLVLAGRPLHAYSERERSRTIGIVLTDKTQAGGLTVSELVALGRQPYTGFFGRLHKHDEELVRQALEDVGLSHMAEAYTSELSDGERQKVMIAKALVQECPFILLDEPTAFLDVVSRIEIMHLLHRLATKENKAILLSTHDIEQALALADRLWLMTRENGLICGVTEDILLSHQMDNLFPSRPQIQFNLRHGYFASDIPAEQAVIIIAENDTLRHWTRNALIRHGFRCVAPCDNTGFPVIEIKSPSDIRLQTVTANFICHSFEELLKKL